MKKVIHNDNNLTEKDSNKLVIRIKALLINNEYIYLAYSNKTYHFPGGHLEENESFSDCLKREVLEETGITINDDKIKEPIMESILYWKNSDKNGLNRKCETYYYVININEEPNIDKIKLTADEKDKGFEIQKVLIKDSIKIIRDNIPNNYMNELIAPDMIEAKALI